MALVCFNCDSVFYCRLWVFIGDYGSVLAAMVFNGEYGFLSAIMGFCQRLWVFISDYGILSMIMGLYL